LSIVCIVDVPLGESPKCAGKTSSYSCWGLLLCQTLHMARTQPNSSNVLCIAIYLNIVSMIRGTTGHTD